MEIQLPGGRRRARLGRRPRLPDRPRRRLHHRRRVESVLGAVPRARASAPTAGPPGSSLAWSGVARAKELLLLGRKLSGAEAAEWGLILRAVPDAELDTAADELIARLAVGPDGRRRPHQAQHPPRPRGLAHRGHGDGVQRPRAELAHPRLQGGPRGVPRGPAAPLHRFVDRETLCPWTSRAIQYEVGDRVATITLDRPEQLNALSPAMISGAPHRLRRAPRPTTTCGPSSSPATGGPSARGPT